jgi:hypothetical protein
MNNIAVENWPSQKQIGKASNYLIETNCFGFFDGGCLIFAEAIKLLIPELHIATILRKKRPDHYGVYLPNKVWGDASGLYSNKYFWVQKFARLENVSGKLDIKEEFIASECVPKNPKLSKKIAQILSS